MKPAEAFLTELARAWTEKPTKLHIIGAMALSLQVDYERGTKDADVLQLASPDADARTHLLALAGPGTELARRWGVYAEIVQNGIPFLPRPIAWRLVELPEAPAVVAVYALDVVDVVVSKLKRFNARDQQDVAAMIRAGHVPHARLVERFRSAVDGFLGDAREDELPIYVENLHEVERDLLGVDESEIVLPDGFE